MFGRAEARDFVDLMAVADRYGLDRLPRAAFPLDETRYEELQVAVGTWKDRALAHAREQERIRGIRRDRGPHLGLGL